MRYTINNETKKTSHGFYLKNRGGDFSRFEENPIMLFAHDLNRPIGRWENIRIEGDELIAEPVFDSDEPSQIIKNKIDSGTLKGISVGMYVKSAEWRNNGVEDTEELFVTEWELLEVSIVSIPSNPKSLISLKIYDAEHNEVTNVEEYINLSFKNRSMKEVKLSAAAYAVLGLEESADENKISSKILALGAEITTLKEKESQRVLEGITDEVNLAIREGKIDATLKDSYIAMGLQNGELLTKTLKGISAKESLSSMVVNSVSDERSTWNYHDWKRKDAEGLAQLKVNNPEEYNALTSGKNRKQK